MSCGVGHRHGLDLMLLWLWLWPVATAPIRHLAWEPPHVVGVALKRQKKKKKKKCSSNHKQQEIHNHFCAYKLSVLPFPPYLNSQVSLQVGLF